MTARALRSALFPYTTLFRSAAWGSGCEGKLLRITCRTGGLDQSGEARGARGEEHTFELQSRVDLVAGRRRGIKDQRGRRGGGRSGRVGKHRPILFPVLRQVR